MATCYGCINYSMFWSQPFNFPYCYDNLGFSGEHVGTLSVTNWVAFSCGGEGEIVLGEKNGKVASAMDIVVNKRAFWVMEVR